MLQDPQGRGCNWTLLNIPLIEKPSQLPLAIAEALRAAFPDLKVGSHQDFDGAWDQTWVLITVERNGPGDRSHEGRKAHALTISLRPWWRRGALPFAACDLASQLKDLVADNRWGLPGPSAICR